MELHVAVHRDDAPPAGPAITLVTEASLRGGWVMGHENVATHAFVVLKTGELHWRLDGEPPTARWRPFAGWQDYGRPVAAWKILITDDQIRAAADKARSLDGTPYDWTEIAGQASAMVRNIPGPLRAVSRLAHAQFMARSMICTRVAQTVLLAAGEPCASEMRRMDDLFPESLGQLLKKAEGRWTERVV